MVTKTFVRTPCAATKVIGPIRSSTLTIYFKSSLPHPSYAELSMHAILSISVLRRARFSALLPQEVSRCSGQTPAFERYNRASSSMKCGSGLSRSLRWPYYRLPIMLPVRNPLAHPPATIRITAIWQPQHLSSIIYSPPTLRRLRMDND